MLARASADCVLVSVAAVSSESSRITRPRPPPPPAHFIGEERRVKRQKHLRGRLTMPL